MNTWADLVAKLRESVAKHNGLGVYHVPVMTNADAAAIVLWARAAEQLRQTRGIAVGKDGQWDWYPYALQLLGWLGRGDKFRMTTAWMRAHFNDEWTNLLWFNVAALAATLDGAGVPVQGLGTPVNIGKAYRDVAMLAYKRMQREDPEAADPDGKAVHKSPPSSPPPPPTVAPPPPAPLVAIAQPQAQPHEPPANSPAGRGRIPPATDVQISP